MILFVFIIVFLISALAALALFAVTNLWIKIILWILVAILIAAGLFALMMGIWWPKE
jgi:hypothetical protein